MNCQNWWPKIDVESINLFSNKPMSTLSNDNHRESCSSWNFSFFFTVTTFLRMKKAFPSLLSRNSLCQSLFLPPLRHLKCKTETPIDLFCGISRLGLYFIDKWPQGICLKLSTILWCRMMEMKFVLFIPPSPHQAYVIFEHFLATGYSLPNRMQLS